MATVDMTPTFAEATAMCIAILENTTNEEAKENARLELMRYAEQYDALIKETDDMVDQLNAAAATSPHQQLTEDTDNA
ncbi:MAG: hypothetical protein R6V30_02245 [Paracoccaceae bacterium]